MSRHTPLLLLLQALLAAPEARAQLAFGVVTATSKVRQQHKPKTASTATIKAARNEFESFQIVFTASSQVSGVSVKLAQVLTGPKGAKIPAKNVVLYREEYYFVKVASNSEGASGYWPDPLIPDVDTYVGEKRKAFPFTVPSGSSRVVWVDVLVPKTATPGSYSGSLQVDAAGKKQGTIPIALKVGNFTLPSTASLTSAFTMDYAIHCYAHTGYESCSSSWNETTASVLRERYIRAGLEHRFSINDPFFQPPFVSSPAEKYGLPLVTGSSSAVRLPGAKLTAVRIDAQTSADIKKWIDYAKKKGFYDKLFYYPVDEPDSSSDWSKFTTEANKLHAVDPKAQIILTSPIQSTNKAGVTNQIDIFCPVINHLEERPGAGTPYDGYQRPKYDSWLKAKAGRKMWAYQSCLSHGCGNCGTPSPAKDDAGWPNRVIDATAVQTRAFPWIAYLFDISGELYFEVAEQLKTAWDNNGQCKFSGSGDGTIFYPGKPSIIGGKTHIPVESVRIKLIREGMEDYEYLVLAAKKDKAKARAIAKTLFPHAYSCNQPHSKLELARNQLFAMLDTPLPTTDGGPPDQGVPDGGKKDGPGKDGPGKDGPGKDGKPADQAGLEGGGHPGLEGGGLPGDAGTAGLGTSLGGSCSMQPIAARGGVWLWGLLLLGLLLGRRRR